MERDPESGLYLPKRPLKRELWPRDDARAFQRLARILEARGAYAQNVPVGLMIVCEACSKGAGTMLPCVAGRDAGTGEITLTCSCTKRILEGLR